LNQQVQADKAQLAAAQEKLKALKLRQAGGSAPSSPSTTQAPKKLTPEQLTQTANF
jgi:hypothetical protein